MDKEKPDSPNIKMKKRRFDALASKNMYPKTRKKTPVGVFCQERDKQSLGNRAGGLHPVDGLSGVFGTELEFLDVYAGHVHRN